MASIQSDCSRIYTAVHNSGPRSASDIKYVVLHSTEGDTAQGAASWFENPNSGGSANLVVDDVVCYRTVADLVTPWGAPPLNKEGFHIEIAGYASWSKARWMLHLPRIKRAAYKTATRCKKYNIPVQFVNAAGLKAGKHGITAHMYVSDAFHESDHQDPGKGFPITTFMFFVKYYLKRL